MTIWFTSDTHFNHDNIIIYSQRPFANVTEMNEHMIRVWNERVKPDHIVYHLGDVVYHPKHDGHMSYDELGARLNGIKKLIAGNHDKERWSDKNKESDGIKIKDHWMWDSVSDYEELHYGKARFILCHYPLETWRNAHRGWYHLHGHCHGTLLRVIPHRVDVGVDCWPDYAPVHIDHLREMFSKQKDYIPQDHHGDPNKKTTYV